MAHPGKWAVAFTLSMIFLIITAAAQSSEDGAGQSTKYDSQQQHQQPPAAAQQQQPAAQQQQPAAQQHQQPPPAAQQHQQPPPVAQQHQQPPPAAQQHQQPPPVAQQHQQPLPAAQQHQQPPPAAQQQQAQPAQQQQPPAAQQHQQQPPAAQQHHQQPPAAQQHQQPPPAAQQHQQPPPAAQEHQQPPQAAQQHQQPPPAAQQHQQPPPAAQQQHQQPPQAAQQQHPPAFQHLPDQQQMHAPSDDRREADSNHPGARDTPSGYQGYDNFRDSPAIPLSGGNPADSIDHDFDKQSDISLQFILPAAEKQCFYYKAHTDFIANFEIVKGSRIDFYINDHSGKTLELAEKKRNANIEISVPEEKAGSVYLACLDNRKDTWTMQQVEVSFMMTADKRREKLSELVSSWSLDEKKEAYENIRSKKEIVVLLNSLGKTLDITEEYQNQFRRIEAHDRSIMEDNFTRVNTWSAFQLVIMVSVGLLQVFMIRSLFDERSSLHKIWKR